MYSGLMVKDKKFEQAVYKITKYKGKDSQYITLSEEAGELLVAASHRRRGRISKAKFMEEMADVMMLIEEFKILEGITEKQFQAMYKKKLRKFYSYVNGPQAMRN